MLRRQQERRILPALTPQPDDFVIATGEQLHRLCHHRKILHLIYAGFAANVCVLYRDYGTRAMSRRGYNVILLRDGTCAIESAETLQEERLLQAAILGIEMFVGSSTTSQALLDACNSLAGKEK
jgi:nicotinamidase-related amidase